MGVTLVFTDRVCAPLSRGSRQDIAELIVSTLDYDRSGRDRRDLAEKILFSQLALAKAGFSTGGRPPYGFRRWLVNESGEPIRQLDPGERVRKRGDSVAIDRLCPYSKLSATLWRAATGMSVACFAGGQGLCPNQVASPSPKDFAIKAGGR